MEWVPEHEGLARYLEDTEVVDWMTPAVEAKARTLTLGADGQRESLRACFEFVRDEIAHSFDIETDLVTCRASEVLEQGTGLCHAKCHLLVALLRARGIPAGFGYQRLRRDPPASGFALHAFVVVWLPGEDRWAALDPRGDNAAVRTAFDLEAPSFAYTPDEDAGERTLDVLLARPPKVIVDTLGRADSLARIRNHLPDGL